eukprot:gene14972-17696_t
MTDSSRCAGDRFTWANPADVLVGIFIMRSEIDPCLNSAMFCNGSLLSVSSSSFLKGPSELPARAYSDIALEAFLEGNLWGQRVGRVGQYTSTCSDGVVQTRLLATSAPARRAAEGFHRSARFVGAVRLRPPFEASCAGSELRARQAQDSANVELAGLTVKQLKAELRSRGCPLGGLKADLVQRLADAMVTEDGLRTDVGVGREAAGSGGGTAHSTANRVAEQMSGSGAKPRARRRGQSRQNSVKADLQYWGYRGGARAKNKGWRIDYTLADRSLTEKVRDVFIRPDVLGSDHCPVGLTITL